MSGRNSAKLAYRELLLMKNRWKSADDITEAIIVEELARVDPSFSVMYCVHVGLCSTTISIHEIEKEKYLTRLAGNEIGAYSLSEGLWNEPRQWSARPS